MKTKEELDAIKNEVETLNSKLAELTADELEQVTGGHTPVFDEDILKEMKLPEFNLNYIQELGGDLNH